MLINQDIINKLKNDNYRLFIYATGAGAGIQQSIWNIPGCSSFFVGAGFPYDTQQTSNIIGYTPDKFVSEELSIELAMAAYTQAFKPKAKNIGIGLTASVASTRIHRGEHQIIVTIFTDNQCITFSRTIDKGMGETQRVIDGAIADKMVIAALEYILGSGYLSWTNRVGSNYTETIVLDTIELARHLVLARPYFKISGERRVGTPTSLNPNNVLFYPGSFNPPHIGHLEGGLAALKESLANRYNELVYTTTVNPLHKAPLTVAEMLQRVKYMKGHNFLLSEGDPLFLDKINRYPGAQFIMGADTLLTMLDPKWGPNPKELMDTFLEQQVKFYLIGRLVNNKFLTKIEILKEFRSSLSKFDQVYYVDKYPHLFIDVPGRWDISSTEIRAKQ